MPQPILGGVQLGIEHPRDQVIEDAGGQEPVPTQGADVHVGNGPVCVVADGVHRLDRQHRAFQGRHTVSGYGNYHELQHGVLPHAVLGHAHVQGGNKNKGIKRKYDPGSAFDWGRLRRALSR